MYRYLNLIERIILYMKRALFLVLSMMVLATLACEFSFSTANIKDIRLATDQDGNNTTTTFAPNDTVYVVFDLRNAPDDTTVQSVWYRLNDDGSEEEIGRSEVLETTDAKVYFNYSVGIGIPTGNYKVEILLDGEREKTLQFTVAEQ